MNTRVHYKVNKEEKMRFKELCIANDVNMSDVIEGFMQRFNSIQKKPSYNFGRVEGETGVSVLSIESNTLREFRRKSKYYKLNMNAVVEWFMLEYGLGRGVNGIWLTQLQ